MDFISTSVNFAGQEEMVLTIYAPHVLQRLKERLFPEYAGNGTDCANLLAGLLEDERLYDIYARVPVYSSVVLFLEKYSLYLIFQMGTKQNPNEVKISTLIHQIGETKRIMVEKTDLCYVLPIEGKLRFGKNKKYFVFKS